MSAVVSAFSGEGISALFSRQRQIAALSLRFCQSPTRGFEFSRERFQVHARVRHRMAACRATYVGTQKCNQARGPRGTASPECVSTKLDESQRFGHGTRYSA